MVYYGRCLGDAVGEAEFLLKNGINESNQEVAARVIAAWGEHSHESLQKLSSELASYQAATAAGDAASAS